MREPLFFYCCAVSSAHLRSLIYQGSREEGRRNPGQLGLQFGLQPLALASRAEASASRARFRLAISGTAFQHRHFEETDVPLSEKLT
jgi:hypothetical protein